MAARKKSGAVHDSAARRIGSSAGSIAIGSRVGAGNACGNGTGSPRSGGGDAFSGKEIAAVWPIVADDDGTAGSTSIGAGGTTGGSPTHSATDGQRAVQGKGVSVLGSAGVSSDFKKTHTT